MVQPAVLKSHKGSKMIETHFYRLYSIMTGSKIIAGSPSKRWHLILKLLSKFYCRFVDKFNVVCHIREEVVPILGAMTDKLVLTFVCGRN